jgi:hypothetical protein
MAAHLETCRKDGGGGLKATESEESGAFAQIAFPPIGIEFDASCGVFECGHKVA